MAEEKKGKTVVKVRWRDCFKFWIAGIILLFLLELIAIVVLVAVIPG